MATMATMAEERDKTMNADCQSLPTAGVTDVLKGSNATGFQPTFEPRLNSTTASSHFL